MIHLFFSFLFLVHPIYISSTNVVINDDKLEVKVKLFRDDLEDGLRDFHGFSISIDSPNKIEKNIDLINKYINDKLILIIDDDKIVLSANDFSLINDVLELSFLKNYINDINSVKVINSLLVEVYSVQSNIIFLEVEEKKYYHQFTSKEIEKTLFIK